MGRNRKILLEVDGKLIDQIFTFDSAYKHAVSVFQKDSNVKEAAIYVSGFLLLQIYNNNGRENNIQEVRQDEV
jgi:hypothetical protein